MRAYGQSYVLGWTIANAAWQPRLSAEYSYASGDATAKDGQCGTFDQFYPSNHGYYGMIDQFGWKNLKNWRAGFNCQLGRKIKVRTDFNQFFLATVQDGLYNSSGSSTASSMPPAVTLDGNEHGGGIPVVEGVEFGAGYGHLFAGDYLKQSKMGFG